VDFVLEVLEGVGQTPLVYRTLERKMMLVRTVNYAGTEGGKKRGKIYFSYYLETVGFDMS
jgi:hypothetical protein